jgi:hypothetical protein
MSRHAGVRLSGPADREDFAGHAGDFEGFLSIRMEKVPE